MGHFCQLKPLRLLFLQKPTKQAVVWLPTVAGLDLYTLLMYLRQNLLQYLHVMNGAEPELYANMDPTAPVPRVPTPLRYGIRRIARDGRGTSTKFPLPELKANTSHVCHPLRG